MAQTKTKPKAKARSKKASAPKRTKPASKPRAAKAKAKSSGSKSRSNGAQAKSNGASSKSSNANLVRHAVDDVGGKAKSAGKTVGKAASKAKIPLVAGGAALAGAAGGLALASTRQAKKSGVGKAMMRRPKIKVDSKDVARAAKEVGTLSAQVGEIANELQRARESANGRHRSPVEVVLQGLTARR